MKAIICEVRPFPLEVSIMTDGKIYTLDIEQDNSVVLRKHISKETAEQLNAAGINIHIDRGADFSEEEG